ncbi:MAG TPA: type IV pilus secretin PilQ, partial [bacterium]|nr:type IV pilus secretin PilQ [bacterium]
TSEASTRVIVEDGQTAVIGGLIRTNESTVERGVPYLKDVPVLGGLFRNTNDVREQRELLIFVTPRIIRSSDA